jgi:nucleotide-binding universal stress UspA family protein
MIETLVVATDGSATVSRAVDCALDLAGRFEAAVHALYVVDATRVEAPPDRLHDDARAALDEQSTEALSAVEATNESRAVPAELETAVRVGRPAERIIDYTDDVEADAVAMGTRGRHGEHSFLVGSVAERVVRMCPQPVLTVRQLE